MQGQYGEFIVRGFDLRDFLETMKDDSMLLNTQLRVSPDVRMERQYVPSSEGWVEAAAQLHLTRGLAYSGSLDPHVASMVIGCDGQRRLNDLLADMAVSLGVDPLNITKHFCSIVRKLIERGFLLPPHILEHVGY